MEHRQIYEIFAAESTIRLNFPFAETFLVYTCGIPFSSKLVSQTSQTEKALLRERPTLQTEVCSVRKPMRCVVFPSVKEHSPNVLGVDPGCKCFGSYSWSLTFVTKAN